MCKRKGTVDFKNLQNKAGEVKREMNHCLGTHLAAAATGLIMVLLSACATRCPHHSPSSTGGGPLPAWKPGDIVETREGNAISFETLIDELANVRVVYVGETHTSAEDHRIQLEVLEALADRDPSLVLAMEMFPRDVQPVLDRYSEGMITEAEMIEEVNWNRVWGYPFELYRGLLSFARDKHLPIRALNAPPEIVRKVARDGLASLTPEERGQIAGDFHMDDQRHRQYVLEEYEQHIKKTIKDFETFYEAQLTWEETMAETLAHELSSLRDREHVLVLVGRGHVSSDVGLPRLTMLRAPCTHKTVIPVPVDDAPEAMGRKIADYIWITKQPAPVAHRGRLGIMLRPASSGEGIEVLAVVPGGIAEKAGIKKGDVVSMFDGTRIRDLEELHKAIEKGAAAHHLVIMRDQQEISIEVSIPH
jgi:uncharacterized iron-regulated protein